MAPDRRIDNDTRDRLTEIAEVYEEFTLRVGWILSALVFLLIAMAIGFTIVLSQLNDRADDAKALATAIQTNRFEVVRNNCLDQNQANVDAKKEVEKRTPADAPNRAKTLEATFAIIDKLSPIENCNIEARQEVTPKPSNTPEEKK